MKRRSDDSAEQKKKRVAKYRYGLVAATWTMIVLAWLFVFVVITGVANYRCCYCYCYCCYYGTAVVRLVVVWCGGL